MRYVMVTDKIRGVYFGKTKTKDGSRYVVLTECRVLFEWRANAGIGSLAVDGPGPGSRIGPTMPRMCVNDVANVFDCTERAVQAWKAAVW